MLVDLGKIDLLRVDLVRVDFERVDLERPNPPGPHISRDMKFYRDPSLGVHITQTPVHLHFKIYMEYQCHGFQRPVTPWLLGPRIN